MFLFADTKGTAQNAGACPELTERLEAVVKQLNGGNEAAIATLFEYLNGGVRFMIRRKLDDCDVEIARRVLLRAAQFALDGKLVSGKAVLHFVTEEVHKSVACEVQRRPEPLGQPAPEPDLELIARLGQLPEKYREAVVRFYSGRESLGGIASSLNLNEEKLQRILARTRKSVGIELPPKASAASA